jgi:hypothetical protein
MGVRRLLSGCAGSLLCAASIASASLAGAQPLPSPSPGPQVDRNAAIITPLREIGRVRARTPYCAALAAARLGVDAAITYQFAVPTVFRDVRYFRLDSELAKHQSLEKTERDLSALWNLATAGRKEVQALRAAANAPGVDEARRKEMLAFANALDGAKARQMYLARRIARTVGTLAEAPVRNLVNTPSDDHGASALSGSRLPGGRAADAVPTIQPYTTPQLEGLEDVDRSQGLFSTFAFERFIRDDLQDAAQHASAAVKLGDCTAL